MVEFYNVKKKAKVQIAADKIEKKIYKRTLKSGKVSERYGFAAVDDDGTKLAKFCSKADFESLGE